MRRTLATSLRAAGLFKVNLGTRRHAQILLEPVSTFEG